MSLYTYTRTCVYSVLQNRLQLLEEDRVNLNTQLTAKRDECSTLLRDIAAYKDQLSALDQAVNSMKASVTQLEIEKELRVRSEVREENERRERIAATAQAMAMESECQHKIRMSEQASQATIAALVSEKGVLAREKEEAQVELNDSVCIILV